MKYFSTTKKLFVKKYLLQALPSESNLSIQQNGMAY